MSRRRGARIPRENRLLRCLRAVCSTGGLGNAPQALIIPSEDSRVYGSVVPRGNLVYPSSRLRRIWRLWLRKALVDGMERTSDGDLMVAKSDRFRCGLEMGTANAFSGCKDSGVALN